MGLHIAAIIFPLNQIEYRELMFINRKLGKSGKEVVLLCLVLFRFRFRFVSRCSTTQSVHIRWEEVFGQFGELLINQTHGNRSQGFNL